MSRDVYVLVLLELWTSSRLYDCVRPCVSLDTVVLPQHCPGVGVPELDASICHAPSRGEQVTLRGQNPGGVCVCGGGAGVRLLHLFKRILSPHSHLIQAAIHSPRAADLEGTPRQRLDGRLVCIDLVHEPEVGIVYAQDVVVAAAGELPTAVRPL